MNIIYIIKLIAIVFALFIFHGVSYAQGLELPQIVLSSQSDIEDASALHLSSDPVISAIKVCMDQGKDNKICQCENMGLIQKNIDLLKSTLIKHPDWKESIVFYETHNAEGFLVGVSMAIPNMIKQTEMVAALDCH